ncbi:ribosomal protein [Coemansia sp. RSA 552]|nr:ribosomal protein [Coemansia sp. RSA 552]
MFATLGRQVAAAAPRVAGARGFSSGSVQAYQARLSQYYHNTLRDDLMVLQYVPPAVQAQREAAAAAQLKASREASDGSAPNPEKSRANARAGRPKQATPTAHNTPFVEKVTVHIRCSEALQNKHHLLSALMLLQTVTGRRGQIIKAKSDAAAWKLRKGMPIAAKVELEGDDMYEFLDKLVEVVLPRMKDYSGLRMTAGDGNGSFTMGFDESVIGLFPEMEMIYDRVPLITGFHVNIATSATRNSPGRLLLSGLGLPFLHHTRKPGSETYSL